jgi:hypothetical protein
MIVEFRLLGAILVPGCLVLVVSWWLMIGNVGYLLTFSPLLVPSSDDKNGFREDVTYLEFGLGFNCIDSFYGIATMSHIVMLIFINC